MVGHVVPEARLGGPIALVQDGDKITIDAASRTIDWDVSVEEVAKRQAEWAASKKSELTVKRGVLMRYARDVAVRASSVVYGCCVLTSVISLQARVRIATERVSATQPSQVTKMLISQDVYNSQPISMYSTHVRSIRDMTSYNLSLSKLRRGTQGRRLGCSWCCPQRLRVGPRG